ncbi:MAG: hypothetical protein ACJ0E3_04920 [Gammaproteobacteria bacterium]
MDKYDEDISSFFDGELDQDSFEKSLSNSTDKRFKEKISMYGVISAAANLNNTNVVPIKNINLNKNRILWLSNGLTAAASILLTVLYINQSDFSRLGVDKDAQDALNLAIKSPEAQEIADSREDNLVNHVLSVVNNSALGSSDPLMDLRNVGFNLNDASKRHYSNGKQNFTMHIEKKNFNLKKVRYWRYGNKNIYLIPLQDGRTLTLYGNLDQKSAQQIINNIKSNQG